MIAACNRDHPDVPVDVSRSGSTAVMSKLQAEFGVGSPQATVVLIADAVAMTQLKNDDRLMDPSDAPAAAARR